MKSLNPSVAQSAHPSVGELPTREAHSKPNVRGWVPGPAYTSIARRAISVVIVFLTAFAAGIALIHAESAIVFGLLGVALFGTTVIRWPYAGLLLYMLMSIVRPAQLFPAIAPLRLEFLVGGGTLTSLLLHQVHTHRALCIDRTATTRFLVFSLAAAFISVPFAIWRLGAMNAVIAFAKLLVVYFLVVHLIDGRRKLRTFSFVYAATITILSALSLHRYLIGRFYQSEGIESRAVGLTGALGSGPNEMGATAATTFPLLLVLGMNPGMRRWRGLFFIGAAVLLIAMALTGSRAAIIGFVAGVGYLSWHSKHRVLLSLAGALLMVGGFTLLPDQYQSRYATIASARQEGSADSRLELWRRGIGMFVSRPITGVGFGNFINANLSAGASEFRTNNLNAHSLYVGVLAQMGLVGSFAFFGFLYVYMRDNRRLQRELDAEVGGWSIEHSLLRGIFAGSVVLLFTGIFGDSLMRITWYLYAALSVSTWRVYARHTRHGKYQQA